VTSPLVGFDTGGRWSGGGHVVLRNLQFAATQHPDVLGEMRDPGAARAAVTLVPRNAVPTSLLRAGGYLVMPQNVWPWSGPWGSFAEARRRLALRVASEAAIRRARGVVRISSLVPPRGRPSTKVLANVLDAEFEDALASEAAPLRADLADTVVSVGGTQSYRNLGLLVRGFLAYRRGGGQLRLLVAGPSVARSVEKELRDLCAGNSAIDLRVEAVDRPRVLSTFRTAHATVFPSVVEVAGPITFLEAGATSPRMAGADIPGLRDSNVALDSITWFDPHDDASIASAFHTLETQPPSASPPELATADARASARVSWAARVSDELRALV